jgi:SAM-dependent methyltransferase
MTTELEQFAGPLMRYREAWVQKALDVAEESLRRNDFDGFSAALRDLPSELFLMLYFDYPQRWPAISSWLPRLPSEEDQALWTGSIGFNTMHQAARFIDDVFVKYGNAAKAPKVLDYGCGWGRMLRLLYNRVPLSSIHGVDPWPPSFDRMRACKVHGAVAQVEYLPQGLPFADKFDLIYSYSIFTHIGPKSQNAILNVLRKHIRRDGLLALTVRPATFWQNEPWPDLSTREKLIEEHFTKGIAFAPHDGPLLDYGATSITVEYIMKEWREWRVDGTQWRAADPYQLIVFLRPV